MLSESQGTNNITKKREATKTDQTKDQTILVQNTNIMRKNNNIVMKYELPKKQLTPRPREASIQSSVEKKSS